MIHPTFSKTIRLAQIFGWTLIFALPVFAQTPKTDEAQELPPNKTLERQMTGAETHRYKISLKKDEFFQVRVEQKGVDAALKLVDASGKTLATMDSPNFKEGFETLSFVAATADSYVLEVSGFDAKAEKGNYTIRREVSRTATTNDRKRVAVEQLFVEGITARNTEGQSETVIIKLEEALRGWQELKDDNLIELTTQQIKQLKAAAKYNEAMALFRQGTKESRQASILKFVEVRRLYSELDDKPNEALILNRLGYISTGLGENEKALEYYNQALPFLREVGNSFNQATTLSSIGEIYSNLGDKQKALEYYNQALPLFIAGGDKGNEATTLSNIGEVYLSLGEKQKAIDYFNQVLSFLRDVGSSGNVAAMLNNIGGVYSSLGEKQKALDYYNQALPIRKHVGDVIGEATTLSNIGKVYSDLGDKQKALEYYNQALPLNRRFANKSGEATILGNIGLIHFERGNIKEALINYSEALGLFRSDADKVGEVTTLYSIGKIYSQIGEKAKAFEFFNQALSLQKAIGDRKGEAVTLLNIGIGYAELGEKQKALDYFELALRLFQIINDRNYQAITLSNLGRAYQQLGDREKAKLYFQKAIALNTIIQNPTKTIIESATTLGESITTTPKVSKPEQKEVQPAYQEAQKAVLIYLQQVEMSRQLGVKATEATALTEIMFIMRALDNPILAIGYGKEAINVYQQLRDEIKGGNIKIQNALLRSLEDTYRFLAVLLIEQGRIPEAEKILRMLKEEEYFQFARGGDSVSELDKRVNLSPSEKEVIARYEKSLDETTRMGAEYAKLEKERLSLPPEKAKEIVARQDELNKKLDNARTTVLIFLESLKKEFSREDKRIAAVEEGLQKEVKGWKDPHAVVISTIVGKEKLYIIVTTSDIQTEEIVDITEEKLNTLVGDYRAALTDPRSDPKPAGQKLYDVLIKPLQKDLDGVSARTLVWSLDGILRYAPMSALWDADKGYLAQRYANVVITLASRGNLALPPEPKDKTGWQVLGVGVSKAFGEFKALGNVPGELSGIVRDSSIVSKTKQNGIMTGRRLLDEQFTYDTFRSNLGRFPIVHAATHFRFISGVRDESLESFLLLGNGEKLTLAKIQSSGTIFNDVQLLALSACDTAYGDKDADGHEVEGFGALAQKKGAKAVLATLWRVDDESTRHLMIAFYGGYQRPNFTKAEALRQAQLALLQEPDKAANGKSAKAGTKKYAHPYFWAPFVLIGNWQ